MSITFILRCVFEGIYGVSLGLGMLDSVNIKYELLIFFINFYLNQLQVHLHPIYQRELQAYQQDCKDDAQQVQRIVKNMEFVSCRLAISIYSLQHILGK
ncbi:hypothetical protein ACJX0J_016838, partial [Zea mays]